MSQLLVNAAYAASARHSRETVFTLVYFAQAVLLAAGYAHARRLRLRRGLLFLALGYTWSLIPLALLGSFHGTGPSFLLQRVWVFFALCTAIPSGAIYLRLARDMIRHRRIVDRRQLDLSQDATLARAPWRLMLSISSSLWLVSLAIGSFVEHWPLAVKLLAATYIPASLLKALVRLVDLDHHHRVVLRVAGLGLCCRETEFLVPWHAISEVTVRRKWGGDLMYVRLRDLDEVFETNAELETSAATKSELLVERLVHWLWSIAINVNILGQAFKILTAGRSPTGGYKIVLHGGRRLAAMREQMEFACEACDAHMVFDDSFEQAGILEIARYIEVRTAFGATQGDA